MSSRNPGTANLVLATLGEEPGMPGLTCTTGSFLAEAAAVCLAHCGHEEDSLLRVTGWKDISYRVRRPPVGPQAIRSHADLQEATEHGACAVAILVARRMTGAQVLERSAKGTGFDYWIGDGESPRFLFTTRLEVSGILRGTPTDVERRAQEKCQQTMRSDATRLDALVCVVEFSGPLAKVIKR
jgi:hypothetical protein